MLQRRHIAIVIAGLLVGAQIVGAVTSDSSPAASAEGYAEQAPVPAEATAPVAEPVSDTTVTESSGYVIPLPGGFRIPVSLSGTFPSSAEDQQMLPALAEYLDKRAATIALTGGPSGFPSAGEEWGPMLPAQVAYFDQLEATRMAAREQQMVARGDTTTPQAITEPLPSQSQPSAEATTAALAPAESGSSADSASQ